MPTKAGLRGILVLLIVGMLIFIFTMPGSRSPSVRADAGDWPTYLAQQRHDSFNAREVFALSIRPQGRFCGANA